MVEHVAAPLRLGVFIADLGRVRLDALKYLIVHLNTLQRHFEFELLPTDFDDEFISNLGPDVLRDREDIRGKVPAFFDRTTKRLNGLVTRYKLLEAPPDRFTIITMSRFDEDYYFMRQGHVGILALGNWEDGMAPPSLFEFIITLLLRQAVAARVEALTRSVHLGTKGCLCDFTASIDEARYKTLQGFLCHFCREALQSSGGEALVRDLELVLGKDWFGTMARPSSVASMTEKLGYNLFVTRGLAPTFWQKIVDTLRDETVKEVAKWAVIALVAFLCFKFGVTLKVGSG
jgi:hypothetical protein